MESREEMLLNNIYNGDCFDVLKTFPDEIVNTCVTSPPYYGLRDYGHDKQIGTEETPEQFINKLVEVFREVRRVLKPDGTLWVNMGDSYSSRWNGGNEDISKAAKISRIKGAKKIPAGLKLKDLMGIPWMLAFALRADGWYLRQDIIWHKPNPMPESVTDRCTKSHEYIFLLSKSQKYYYDGDAIKEPKAFSTITDKRDNSDGERRNRNFPGSSSNGGTNLGGSVGDRNKRSVWTVTTKPFKDAHFATFPQDLIKPCILAGSPENGIVLDPFMGGGTTAVVSRKLGRNYIGIELNSAYIAIAEKRLTTEIGLFAV